MDVYSYYLKRITTLTIRTCLMPELDMYTYH